MCIRDSLTLAARIAAARVRGDLVHLHTNGHNPGSWRLAAVVGASLDGRALLTLHSGFAPEYIDAHPRLCRLVSARYAAVVCVNRSIADALARAGFDEDRLIVAPAFSASALPLPLPPPGLAAIRARHRPLLAATLAPGAEYGAETLVAAFRLLQRSMPSAGLVVYGPAARSPSLAARFARWHLTPSVSCYGDLGRAAALGVVHAADVLVRPTLTDGDALSVREALALGRRVVASDVAPRPRGVVLFRSGDPSALARAVEIALARPAPEPVLTDNFAPVLALYALLAGPARRSEAPAVEHAAMQQGAA